MLYGAAAAGIRAMTASSGPGISLMQEGVSYLCGAELPCVIADVMRGGPGLGNIADEQSDYMQVVKGGGHGYYHSLVLAPDSVQEMCDLTMLAFSLADAYRNPVYILADGFIGQIMEPVEIPERAILPEPPAWAGRGTLETRNNLISSIYLDSDWLERHVRKLEAKYERAAREAVRYETRYTEDADFVLIGFGIVARILKSVVSQARTEGIRVGLLRPISLFPFPTEAIRDLAQTAKVFLVVEMSPGQLMEDVRLSVEGRKPVELYARVGGNVPSAQEILEKLRSIAVQNAAQRELAHV
jgi:pyruvate/2-oxoacid:ferredoxin oxidoreductase alpha subunit